MLGGSIYEKHGYKNNRNFDIYAINRHNGVQHGKSEAREKWYIQLY